LGRLTVSATPNEPPFVLAVQTAQQPGSVALLRGEEIVAETRFADGRRGGGELAPAVRALLERAPGGRIDFVAVALGPGSYTGSRLGLSFAEFFAFGRGVPLLGVCDLAALAQRASAPGERVATGVVAHDGRVFAAVYAGRAHDEPEEVAAPAIVAADAFAALAALHGARAVLAPPEEATAADVGRLAARRFARTGRGDAPTTLEPLYLQPASPERTGP
jgi:tRNA threonylcarbamoyl adenosine modification protein YeaZ